MKNHGKLGSNKNIILHVGDVRNQLSSMKYMAIDTETRGLEIQRDRLCVLQFTCGDGICHLVQIDKNNPKKAKNLIEILSDNNIEKLFHFGRFDIAVIYKYLGVLCQNVYCTKIASKLARTYTERHGLKELCRQLLGIEISKNEQSSDWGAEELTQAQKHYAANDVMYLNQLKTCLNYQLRRENLMEIANECFKFLPQSSKLAAMGVTQDIF